MHHSPSLFVENLEELFADVQLSGLYPDQKTFADCIPKFPVPDILKQYRIENKKTGFNLADFVSRHFEVPMQGQNQFKTDLSKNIEEHISSLWSVLTRTATDNHSSLLALPYPFVVPGGRFREFFYWDSYFTMLGLQVSGRSDLIKSMIANFAHLIDQFGFIPNGNRTYFLSRSQPPFFSLMVELLAIETGGAAYSKYLPQLHQEYLFWMNGKELLHGQQRDYQHLVLMPDGELLNRYFDKLNSPRPESFLEDTQTMAHSGPSICLNIRAACESGWDFSSRWFKDQKNLNTAHTTDIVPIDLNCLLWHLEKTIGKAEGLNGNFKTAALFEEQAESREQAIQKYLWSAAEGMYYDYQHSAEKQTNFPSIAMAYPLYFGMASAAQAKALASVIEKDFLKAGGLLTTLNHSGQQWDAPNGWAPLQWIAFKGLKNYGFLELAEKIRTNWTTMVEQHFKETGKISEKYNVQDTAMLATGGEYPNQDGFGWTNGVYLKMKSETL